ncbi:50S ribosomal protein L3 N(5)-glutamine methyltransferase [Pseudidiomarina insulisalsae]|uniref:Ribosomal protein uL3 glutamine methyltransferase n=1 Tax=Pseudidiomarina insulisalsae TaxID=575789 RepID=A0A432YCJ4_9GAMM|nr:50S ribosomal protein L3 N(5)-glutamine methyltransferase [Pseudidiomarina insulisalsae]RUO58586.1 50S ribosomal protein L3 N(5)-glutamine methyltransferase [Pseudidiomarina insulisalsae]
MLEHKVKAPLTELTRIEDYWRWGVSTLHAADVFFGHGTDNADTETQVLLAHVLHLDLQQLQQFRAATMTMTEREQFVELLVRRIDERKPAAYLTGEAWFAGLPFKVDERVLIPRSPIGELIENEFQPWLTEPPQHILDLCTGSGCIAIACAYAFPDAEVDALDISTDALAVAEENIAAHQLEHRVFPMVSNLYQAVPEQRYDLIVTNPPYVDAEDMADLPAEFHHEPELGLAAGDDGLDLVRTILREAPDHLTEQGILICEVGNSMVHIMELYPDVPFTWLSFERGGDGVFLMTRQELLEHQAKF